MSTDCGISRFSCTAEYSTHRSRTIQHHARGHRTLRVSGRRERSACTPADHAGPLDALVRVHESHLLNDVIRSKLQRPRNREVKFLRYVQVHHEVEPRRLLDREFCRSRPAQNLLGEVRGPAP